MFWAETSLTAFDALGLANLNGRSTKQSDRKGQENEKKSKQTKGFEKKSKGNKRK